MLYTRLTPFKIKDITSEDVFVEEFDICHFFFFHHLFKLSQTRCAAQPPGAALQPEHDGHVTVHVAALADGHAVEAAETEEAGLAAEQVHNTLLDDLVFALQNFGVGETGGGS